MLSDKKSQPGIHGGEKGRYVGQDCQRIFNTGNSHPEACDLNQQPVVEPRPGMPGSFGGVGASVEFPQVMSRIVKGLQDAPCVIERIDREGNELAVHQYSRNMVDDHGQDHGATQQPDQGALEVLAHRWPDRKEKL